MFTSACAAIIVVRPSATNAPNVSSARAEMRSPRQAMTQKQRRMAVAPTRPSSSPITA